MNTILLPSNIEGNITSCKIENQLIGIKKESVFSLQKVERYATYDVCSQRIIMEYDVPGFTALGGVSFMIGVFIIVMIIFKR